MRLFLGINLSESQKQQIASLLSPVKKSEKGWESSHDYHVTLLFIGEAPADAQATIEKKMAEISAPAFSVETTGVHFFNRRIMYLGIAPSPELSALRSQIRAIFPEYVGKDEKPFVPHITLKRWQRYEHEDLIRGIADHPVGRLTIPVTTVALFKSEKSAENRKYHVIFRTPLI